VVLFWAIPPALNLAMLPSTTAYQGEERVPQIKNADAAHTI
jgi:hypothetical protein